MNQFNLGNFLNKFINQSLANPKPHQRNIPMSPEAAMQMKQEALAENLIKRKIPEQFSFRMSQHNFAENLKMNQFQNFERGTYLKELMNMPKEIEEALILVQKNMQAGKDLQKLLATNINISELAELMKQSGKEAMNKMIMVMSNASKQGINDVSQLKDAINFINASVSVAEQNNPTQVLKTFILLYLPWLPLQEGVDFDLEIESSAEEEGENGGETSLSILISTIHFGNIKVTLVLFGVNSLSVIINCCDSFPKEELLKRIEAESKSHAMNSNITFEEKITQNSDSQKRQAKINMQTLSQVNPFLLLMANAIIRHTIELDNLASNP